MDESELDESQRLSIYQIQRKVLERAIRGDGLVSSMELLCREIEQTLKDDRAICSILLLDNQRLKHCAAPSLPEAYCEAIDGVTIGEGIGSCGTALFRQEQVVVTDIATDPLWQDFRDLAMSNGLGACWSNPIIASDGTVLASFAIYYPDQRSPSRLHLYLIQAFSALALLVIDHYRLAEQQSRLTAALGKINARLTAVMQVIPDVAIVLDQSGHYIDFCGATFELMTPPETLWGKSIENLFEPELAAQVMKVARETLATGEMQIFEYEVVTDGERRVFEGRTAIVDDFDTDGRDDSYVLWMAREVTSRKCAEENAARLALFDALTGLPNRRHAEEQLEQLLEEVNRGHASGAVMFLDLNDFKRINDSLGHQQGDLLLQQVARRLEDQTRRSEMVARLGGDEFIVLLRESLTGKDELAESTGAVARRILDCFNAPLESQGHAYSVSVSVGIALADRPGLKTEDLLRNADAAMYAAKRLGGNRVAFFEESLQREADRRLDLERRMVHAIRNMHFLAYFQPQLTPGGALFGAEALLRWFDPEEGAISPDAFIPVAERAGLIYQLQDIVFEQSCQMLAELRKKDRLPAAFRLAINISPLQLQNYRLTERLDFFLAEYDLTADRFTLEITENLLMGQQQETYQQMQALRQRGFRFAIDDFGTGYSSLAYLHRLDVDQLKIDKSFIRELGETVAGEAIVDSVAALSRSLNFEVIAEGVETELQARILHDKPLTGLQGYLYARPMNSADLMDYVASLPRNPGSA